MTLFSISTENRSTRLDVSVYYPASATPHHPHWIVFAEGDVKWCNLYGREFGSIQQKGIYPESANSLLGIYLKDKTAKTQSDLCTRLLILALFVRRKDWKQPECPSVPQTMARPQWSTAQLSKGNGEAFRRL